MMHTPEDRQNRRQAIRCLAGALALLTSDEPGDGEALALAATVVVLLEKLPGAREVANKLVDAEVAKRARFKP